MPYSRILKSTATTGQTFHIGKKTQLGASGVVVGAIVAGPIGALLGGVLGTAFGAAATMTPITGELEDASKEPPAKTSPKKSKLRKPRASGSPKAAKKSATSRHRRRPRKSD